MTALPMSVAPKNVQNGTKKWPQVIPAKSKSGFGIYFIIFSISQKSNILVNASEWEMKIQWFTEAQARIPKKPTFFTKRSTPNLARSIHVLTID